MARMKSTRTMIRSWSALTVLCTAPAIIGAQSRTPSATLVATVLSSKPHLVAGGDALLSVRIPGSASSPTIRVTVNDRDVTAAFRWDAGGKALIGLLTDLKLGENMVAATTEDARTSLTLVNYPISGPILSGPAEQPFLCDTERFKLPSGETLGLALDDNCSIKTRVDYFYRSTAGDRLKLLVDPRSLPADVAQAQTLTGAMVPYVVRLETGTINRAIYQIAMLHNPGEAPRDFRTRPSGWNGRLIYTFGGGCPGGWYRQGASTGGVDDDVMLRQGYAVASASLNVFGNNCNDLLASETMMMVKEHFIEGYGQPEFTIGWGCSGGSYQAHQIADNYPGLLDGIVVGCSFPDVGYTSVSVHSFGARLLSRYFDHAAVPWTRDEQVAASGLPNYDSLSIQGTRPDRISPRGVCDPALPAALLYDPIRNPRGARCTVYDHTVNVYGRDPATGFARRFLDNVGVQYGLGALNARMISVPQFLDLNEHIGGIDIDANFVPARTAGDARALREAYETGRILNGGGGLRTTPIIDYRGYADFAKGDPHMRFYSFSTRERLIRVNGHGDNQVMLVEDGATYGLFSTRSPVVREALLQMDRWLTTLARDASGDSTSQRVVLAKPPGLVDACYDRTGNKIAEKQSYGGRSACNDLFPSHSSPYLVAGMPLANDVVKCQLKPVDRGDYQVPMTEAEMERVRRMFPSGVCDYTKPGVEQRPLRGTWLSFGPSPVNNRGPS
jgi:hypothetical protein